MLYFLFHVWQPEATMNTINRSSKKIPTIKSLETI